MTSLTSPWVMVVVVLLGLVVSGCAVTAPFLVENVHEVVPGVVVRSAQLSAQRLEALIQSRKIRSVINLRGASPGVEWYDQERAAALRANVEHLDFELSSAREVPPEQAAQLIELMQRAPKPMLIHCWAGADRTGLASALYLYAISKQKPKRAASALSIRYYHLPFFSAGAMDRSFRTFVEGSATLSAARRTDAKIEGAVAAD